MAVRCQRPSRALSAQFVTGVSGSGKARATIQNDRGAWVRLRSARHSSGMVHVDSEEEVRQIAKVIREAGREILVTIDGRVATVPVRGATLPVQRAIEHCERVPGRSYPAAPMPRDLSLPSDLRGPAPGRPGEGADPAPSPRGVVGDPTQL